MQRELLRGSLCAFLARMIVQCVENSECGKGGLGGRDPLDSLACKPVGFMPVALGKCAIVPRTNDHHWLM